MNATTVFRTVVFAADGLRGNTATVVFLPGPPSARQTQALRATQNTTCLTWSQRDGIGVRCYYRGNSVAFCGHGLLAVANLWFLRTGVCPSLRSRTERYSTRLDNGCLWLRAPRLRCRDSVLPDHCGDWFEPGAALPWRGAVAGGERGYRIVEWPPDTELARLRPRFDAMIARESRAIIATQAFTAARRLPWDFSLRYFAPRYGTPEDSATGSANAVLADYWNGRGLLRGRGTDATFRARQCSEDGGVVMSRVGDSFAEIGGSFHVIETTASGLGPTAVSATVRA
jgi:predicted PhzF superfamily epimerase YddE/YHI9